MRGKGTMTIMVNKTLYYDYTCREYMSLETLA
jgi:hypothetical protein